MQPSAEPERQRPARRPSPAPQQGASWTLAVAAATAGAALLLAFGGLPGAPPAEAPSSPAASSLTPPLRAAAPPAQEASIGPSLAASPASEPEPEHWTWAQGDPAPGQAPSARAAADRLRTVPAAGAQDCHCSPLKPDFAQGAAVGGTPSSWERIYAGASGFTRASDAFEGSLGGAPASWSDCQTSAGTSPAGSPGARRR